MCTRILVCHGDRANVLPESYDTAATKPASVDCKPALYYITNDGKYAIDADYVSAQDIASGTIDLDKVPKIELSKK